MKALDEIYKMYTHVCTFGKQSENHEKPLFQAGSPGQKHAAEKRATSDTHESAAPLKSRENRKRRRHFCNFYGKRFCKICVHEYL